MTVPSRDLAFSPPPAPLVARYQALARRLGVAPPPRLVVGPAWGPDAAVCGLRGRHILISEGLLHTMPPHLVDAVLGHELGHVRDPRAWHLTALQLLHVLLLALMFLSGPLNLLLIALVGPNMPRLVTFTALALLAALVRPWLLGVRQRAHWRAEFAADAAGAEVAGTGAMCETLHWFHTRAVRLGHPPHLDGEGPEHPGCRARIAVLSGQARGSGPPARLAPVVPGTP